jgi:4-amino-4-deoxy-L-arabinose transferase-like glycosyltransferase
MDGEPVAGVRNARPFFVGVGLALGLGAALRLANLGTHGLWYDEVLTAQVRTLSTPGEVFGILQVWGDHTPLAFFVSWAARGLGGDEWAVRLPYALAGIGAVGALAWLARALLPLRCTILAALLMAAAPFAIYYSQEARPYAFLMLFTALQMLAAYRAATCGTVWDWTALTLLSILNLYTGYLAIFAAASAYGYAGLSTLIRTWRERGGNKEYGGLWRRWALLTLSAGITFLAYVPWLPFLGQFLARRDLGFGRLRGESVTLGDAYALVDSLGLGGPLLVLLVVGLGGAIWSVVRKRHEGGLLALVWLGVPVGAFIAAGGASVLTLPTRYFSFLFPLGILLVAWGADLAIQALGSGLSRLGRSTDLRRRLEPIGFAALGVLALAWALPAVVRDYSTPKAQFREAAEHVAAQSPPGSLVMVVGAFNTSLLPPFVREAVAYYYDLRQLPFRVIEGTRLSGSDLSEISGKDLWLAHTTEPRPDDLQSAREVGFEVVKLNSVTMLRAPGDTPNEKALTAVRWAEPRYPALAATRALFDPDYQAEALGPNLLPQTTQAVAGTVLLKPEGQRAEAATETTEVAQGRLYVLLFSCSTTEPNGEARVYVDTYDTAGRSLETLPEWYGYRCINDPEMPRQATAFRATEGISRLKVRLVAEGAGEVHFSNMELREVSQSP